MRPMLRLRLLPFAWLSLQLQLLLHPLLPRATRLALIPSFNSGPQVYATVRAARAQWCPVWVLMDGGTDGTAAGLQQLAAVDAYLRVCVLPHNSGKGAAVLHGLQAAAAAGYTHALTMDADGQHWRGVKPVNVDAPVKYLTAEECGVSHFRYGRDNVLLTWMHTRLMVEFVLRLPALLLRKLRKLPPFQT